MRRLLRRVWQVWADAQPEGVPEPTWLSITQDALMGVLVGSVMFVNIVMIAVIGAWQ